MKLYNLELVSNLASQSGSRFRGSSPETIILAKVARNWKAKLTPSETLFSTAVSDRYAVPKEGIGQGVHTQLHVEDM